MVEHKGTKAQRKPANKSHLKPAFFVPWCLCVFVFNNNTSKVLNSYGIFHRAYHDLGRRLWFFAMLNFFDDVPDDAIALLRLELFLHSAKRHAHDVPVVEL